MQARKIKLLFYYVYQVESQNRKILILTLVMKFFIDFQKVFVIEIEK